MAADTAGQSSVAFRLIGPLAMIAGGRQVDLHLADSSKEILAFLLLNANRELRRGRLLTELWPDRSEQSARALLNTTLWRLKRELGKTLPPVLSISSHGDNLKVSLEAEARIDVLDLHSATGRVSPIATEEGSTAKVFGELDQLVDAMTGEFLEGFDSEWILVERERIFNLQIRALTLLMRDRADQGDYERALELGRLILHKDPMRESVQRQVIWLYVLSGQRYAAVLQYRNFAALLRKEIGVAPMPETQALYDHILNSAGPTDARAGGDGSPPGSSPRKAANRGDGETLLKSLFADLSDHRRSIYAVLADDGFRHP